MSRTWIVITSAGVLLSLPSVGRTLPMVARSMREDNLSIATKGQCVCWRAVNWRVQDEVRTRLPSRENSAGEQPTQGDQAVSTIPLSPPGLDVGFSAVGWPYTLSPHDQAMSIEDCWPPLYFGVERVPEMRRKIEKLQWAKAAFEQMRREAEAALETEPVQPIERVGWRHDFYSRRTGEHLIYDPLSPDRFLDPWSGAYEDLPEQRRAWVLLTHERTHRLMRSLGFLYALTGDERYARWVAEGMRRAAEMFRHTELRSHERDGALYFQPLYDAQALLILCDAYVLTRNSPAYAQADHDAIRKAIFEDGISYQIRFLDKSGIHNMSCYVAAAVATIGHYFGRQDWLHRGLYDERNGLVSLIKQGVPSAEDNAYDGFWFEGTMFYHYYSLCPLVALYELDRRLGGAASSDPEVRSRFEAMFAAPVSVADSQLRLPTIGDLGAPKVMSLHLYRHLYEYAAGQVNPDRFGPLLAALYSTGIPRNSLAALAFGPDVLPQAQCPSGAALLRCHGIGVMRGPNDWYLLFKSGPHGAGHDHFDKLEIAFNALGQVIAPDLGTAGYALGDIHRYYRGTFSHNTLFVDEQNQGPVHDASLVWMPGDTPAYGCGTVRDAYEGVALTRRIWFDPPYVVLADCAVSQAEHRYGWIFHAYGSLSTRVWRVVGDLGLPPIAPLEGILSAPQTASTDGLLDATWRVAQGVYLRLLATSDGPFEATVGRAPGNPMPDDQGVVILRAPGQQRHFWAVFEVHRGSHSVAALAPDGEVVALRVADGSTRWYRPPVQGF